ncbi:MAG: hypothetical protein ABIA76_03075 [Candidatus Diapherotrites archaeon]
MSSNEKPVNEKIQRIALECSEAGATKWETAKIIKALQETEQSERKLRKKAMEELKELNPEAAKVMDSFTKLQVFTSHEWLEAFDRGNIIKSLLKETNIPRTIAERIGSDVEDKLKDLKINYLNTAIIREMVNVKLLEYGHESIHSQYARLGLPVFEAKKRIQEGKTSTKFVFRELNWLSEIPEKTRKQQFQGKIFMHFPHDFSSKVFGINFTPKTKADNLFELLSDTMSELKKNALNSSVFPAINSLNFVFARSNRKNSKKEIDIFAKSAVKLIEAMNPEEEFNPVMGIDLLQPKEGEFSKKSKEKAIEFGIALNNAAKKTKVKCILRSDSEFKAKLLKSNKGNLYLNCAEKELFPVTEFIYSDEGKGVINFTELNLPFLALEAEKKETFFIELLNESIHAFNEANEMKKKLLEKRKEMNEFNLDKFNNILGLWGLEQAGEILGINELSKLVSKELKSVSQKSIALDCFTKKAENKFLEAVVREFRIQLKEGQKKASAENFPQFQEMFSKKKIIPADF